MIRRYSLLLLLVALSSGRLFAQGTSTGSSQLKIPLDARTAALSQANVADDGQLSSWLLNPANLYSRGNLTVTLTHSQWIQDIQSEFLAAQIPISWGTIGLGISTNSVPGIEVRDIPGPSLGTFSARFTALQLGIAASPVQNVSFGASAKYLYEKLYADDATGYGFDVGLLYETPITGLQAAVAVTNTGSLDQFRQERSDLPAFCRGGLAYSSSSNDFAFSVNASFASDLQQNESHLLGSLEATYNNAVSARLGYASGYDSRGLTGGLGIRYEFLQFSYAFVPFSLGLGDAHLFTLAFQF
jgi:hypothetical protein